MYSNECFGLYRREIGKYTSVINIEKLLHQSSRQCTTRIMPTLLLYLPGSHLSSLCISLSPLSNAGCLLSYIGIHNLFFGEQFSPFSSLWFPKISVVYSCSFKEYQYISEKSRTHSRRYRGWNPWFYGNVSIMVIKAWMSNYNCLTMMILRKCRANYEELTSLINTIHSSMP